MNWSTRLRMLKTLPMYWFGRLYVALHVGNLAITACFGEDTLFYKIMESSGEAGFWCVLALAAVSVVGVLDVFINDLLPRQFCLNFVKKHRHFLLMALAIGPMSMAFVIAKEVGWSVLHISLSLPIAGTMLLAVMDVYARGRQK